MEIKIIYDNCKGCSELQADWGFSAYIEVDEYTFLFDTGNNREIFFSNLEKMGLELDKITDVIFSHKHSDHISGCSEILQKLPKNTRVYHPKGFPLKKIPQAHVQTFIVRNLLEIRENIFCMPLKGGFFLHEQALVFKVKEGLIILTGCAHPGIINIAENAKIQLGQNVHLVLGGFHLFRKNLKSIDEIINQLKLLQVEKVAPCHCSGEQAIQRFQEIYRDDFYKIGAGSVVKI